MISGGVGLINDAIKESVLYEFLGADGIEELKKKLIDMIVEQVRKELDDSYSYIISPEALYEELHDAVVDRVVCDVEADYKEYLSEAAKKHIEKLVSA